MRHKRSVDKEWRGGRIARQTSRMCRTKERTREAKTESPRNKVKSKKKKRYTENWIKEKKRQAWNTAEVREKDYMGDKVNEKEEDRERKRKDAETIGENKEGGTYQTSWKKVDRSWWGEKMEREGTNGKRELKQRERGTPSVRTSVHRRAHISSA